MVARWSSGWPHSKRVLGSNLMVNQGLVGFLRLYSCHLLWRVRQRLFESEPEISALSCWLSLGYRQNKQFLEVTLAFRKLLLPSNIFLEEKI